MRPLALRGAVGAVLVLAAACTQGTRAPEPPVRPGAPSVVSATKVSEEPWTFGSAAGRVIATPSYRVFTTVEPGMISERLPEFAEHALARYRTAFIPLALPAQALDTYVLANRPQWTRAAAQLLGDASAPYQQIVRGGITVNGRSVLYDIGPRDTFSLLAHEGWHQYTQNTFREPLPIWLEEGIAAVMEGFRWRADLPRVPEFLPWCNLERYDHLRDAAVRGTLLPLDRVLAGSPADSLDGGTDPALTYYAQAWALTLYLMEGAEGRHRASLGSLVADAQRGGISRRLGESLGQRVGGPYRTGGYGLGVFRAYFGTDLLAEDAAYRAFCLGAVAPGGREAAALGRSPLVRRP